VLHSSLVDYYVNFQNFLLFREREKHKWACFLSLLNYVAHNEILLDNVYNVIVTIDCQAFVFLPSRPSKHNPEKHWKEQVYT
jgi:uncharacterized protein YpiB (UPF0302 family)